MLVVDSNRDEIINLKMQLSGEFDMKNLSPAKRILGMQITKNKKEKKSYVIISIKKVHQLCFAKI